MLEKKMQPTFFDDCVIRNYTTVITFMLQEMTRKCITIYLIQKKKKKKEY